MFGYMCLVFIFMLRSIMILLQAVHEKQLVNEYTPKFGILSYSLSVICVSFAAAAAAESDELYTALANAHTLTIIRNFINAINTIVIYACTFNVCFRFFSRVYSFYIAFTTTAVHGRIIIRMVHVLPLSLVNL